jgi:rare lipoprotein A (RlpA)-like double-psi beta-barrel protein/surface rod structure-forming protein G/uncharacterized protein DUF348
VRVATTRAQRLRARRAAYRLRFACGALFATVVVAGLFRVVGHGAEPRPAVQVPVTALAAHPKADRGLMTGRDQGLGVWVVEGVGGRMLGILRGPDREAVSTVSGVGPMPLPAVTATVVTQGKARDVVTNAANVEQLLSAMGMRPDASDRVTPPLQTPLPRAPRIEFSNVDSRYVTVETSMPYSVVTTTSADLSPGEVRVVRNGVPGDALVSYWLRFVDGVAVSKIRVGQTVLTSPVDEARMVGVASATGTTKSGVSGGSTAASPSPSGTGPGRHAQIGQATWYHAPSHGMTAASPSLPFGTHVTVTNLANGKSVTVVINDRGPFGGRLIDLSEEAFARIARPSEGVIRARLTW